MGEEIARFSDQLPANEWVLVGHGDWSVGQRTPNPLEPGVYMPLTRKDIEVYGPARVFLGHIHAPMNESPVYYAGSPCGLDITETGRRRYLIYDTVTNQVESRTLETPVLYFDESFIILPVDDEIAYLLEQIEDRKKKWRLKPEEQTKTVLRVKVRGYSADKSAVRQALKEAFDGFSFYKGEEPDDSNISESSDRERQHVAEQVRASVEKLEWRTNAEDEPDQHEILLEALHIIYGG
jgi:DNA repair exonuclease SbcCD nuclease subunit